MSEEKTPETNPSSESLIIECLVSPPLGTNAYLVADPASAQALAVDPSCVGEELLARCRERGWKLIGIVLTHGHIDHTHDTASLARATGCPILCHTQTGPLLEDENRCGALWLGMQLEPAHATRLLEEDDTIALGGQTLRVLHTPGHTPGCMCLLGDGVCLTGDLLFRDSVGRWDFPEGDEEQLVASLRKLVARCPETTRLYPGHGPETTLARERHQNPYLLEWL
ncbi:MAG TPA: MBL fold metallo-hydrolase [Candidatus Sumerlaeota bacterium]|nr:MBL fold metallo-hydrolase [Candidatus Sumerlaeota bacterium]